MFLLYSFLECGKLLNLYCTLLLGLRVHLLLITSIPVFLPIAHSPTGLWNKESSASVGARSALVKVGCWLNGPPPPRIHPCSNAFPIISDLAKESRMLRRRRLKKPKSVPVCHWDKSSIWQIRHTVSQNLTFSVGHVSAYNLFIYGIFFIDFCNWQFKNVSLQVIVFILRRTYAMQSPIPHPASVCFPISLCFLLLS
jgi:hypothetical protein